MSHQKKIAIFGGGIGGLTVAHELAERGGYDITIYEKTGACGGKASSYVTPEGQPGEHSIHSVGYVYYHLRDTMKRIPTSRGTVADNIISAPAGSRKYFYFTGAEPVMLPFYFPWKPSHFREYRTYQKHLNQVVSQKEVSSFVWQMFKVACMCQQRRIDTLDKLTWGEFLDVKHKSRAYFDTLARIPEFYVGADEHANARSLAMLCQKVMFYQIMHPFASQRWSADLFNGPSSEVFIQPWVEYLQKLHVAFKMHYTLVKINIENNLVHSVQVKTPEGNEITVTADCYVFALPVEIMRDLATETVKQAAPSLKNIHKILTMPSSGIQFYNRADNHELFPQSWTLYSNSPWAILSVYQSKLVWPYYEFKDPVKGILSVAWSNFEVPGILFNKPAKDCTADEIKQEVLAQMRAHKGAETYIDALDLGGYFMGPDLVFDQKTGVMQAHNAKLFIQPPGSWGFQPDAVTEVPNMFLAADYIHSTFDLATMEAANEAGRRAANGILDYTRHQGRRCFARSTPRTGFALIEFFDSILYKIQKWWSGKEKA